MALRLRTSLGGVSSFGPRRCSIASWSQSADRHGTGDVAGPRQGPKHDAFDVQGTRKS